ncbi:hypothetical protein SP60_05910 [Candidatus Thioglobus autotrophicus]|jgi:cell division protein FtsL|uniref:Cell division protein FtsL n=1 Tax=Candidatus Thioglobus autotrophicus TaxID=1705394 RepID=A0A0M5LES0_9GAMM|nr:cell division protein FtsL [Candidatus Thioglobus autotrophicus]ALE52778.1 hypothetical protein SP60_05910 [Candidatus Thioglobus autotrophicus]WPE16821.1 cell division protein FtsL [Candidatus Thioglobus autotrophicus]WPE18373.1 cell division protein FtsL [Candidatus Thioglobus autotrophicus]
MPAAINKLQLNLVLLFAIVALSLLSIVWHHQTYTLYKQIKRATTQQHQMMALNKQLLSEHSQIMSGDEIKVHAINQLKMKEPEPGDFGRWFKGNLSL